MLSPLSDATAYKQLPKEISQPVSFSRVLVNLLGAVGVVFLFNLLAITYFQNDFVNLGDYIVREKWHLLRTMEEPADWLILGDSSANQGLVPAVLNEELGARTVNLATIADWVLVGDVWMLQAYLERFEPPEHIIIGHVYDVYPRNFRVSMLGQSPLKWGEWESFTPAVHLDLEAEVNFFLTRYLPLYYRNTTLQEVITQAFYSPQTLIAGPSSTVNENGYMATYAADPQSVVSDAQFHEDVIENLHEGRFEVSEINQQAMDELIRLAEEHQMNIYFVNAPMYRQLYRDPIYQDYFAQLQEWMYLTTSRSSYIHYIDRSFLFSRDELETVDHTTDPNSREYTYEIASEIKKLLTVEVLN